MVDWAQTVGITAQALGETSGLFFVRKTSYRTRLVDGLRDDDQDGTEEHGKDD
jgi:hypothetical protein